MAGPGAFVKDKRGGLAVYAGMAVPVILVLAGGVLDLTSVLAERGRLRSIAEGAALAGASTLALASDRSIAPTRAQAWAEQEIAQWNGAPDATVTAEIVEIQNPDRRRERGIRVNIVANRESLFGRLLPPGGWTINVNATAISVGRTPLCVIATRRSGDKVINIKDRGSLRAPGCLVHSNRDVRLESGARLEAGAIQAVTSLNGVDGSSGAQSLPDPFEDIDLNPPSCSYTAEVEYSTGVHTLPAGVHCAKIIVRGTAVLRLAPGEHWFVNADLEVKEDARLEGVDVVLLFDDHSKFKFDDRARVTLEGREEGLLAGFVMAAVRDNSHDFIITSENVENLLGVVYVPNARLIIDGKAEVAQESAWTVLVAESIELKGNPTLYVNANYRASDVPVPDGVGPSRAMTRLVN